MTAGAPGGAADPLLDQAVQRLAHTLERSLLGVCAELAGDLEGAAAFEASARDRQALLAAAGLLRLQSAERVGRAARGLADRAARCQEYAAREIDADRVLGLLQEDEPGQQVLVGDVARAVRAIVGADYLSLMDRVHALWPQAWPDDDLNPLGARILASAAVAALEPAPGAVEPVLTQTRRSVLRRLPAVLALALEDIARWLADPGGRMSGRRREPSGMGPGRPAVSPGGRALDASQHAADAARLLGSSSLAAAGPLPLPALPTLQPVVELERDALAFAHAIGVPPHSRQARERFFANARARLREVGMPAPQLAVVDVVAALFDYLIDDHRLPDGARAMLWRLQQPALALALMDPGYLGDEPRSLRRLLENLGALVTAYGDQLERGGELHRRLETVVRAVEIVAGALQSRAFVLSREVEREYARAARNVTQLVERLQRDAAARQPRAPAGRNRRDYRRRPSPQREQELTVRLSVMIGERLERHQVPGSVREFLLTVWLRQLRTTALRDGEESGQFKVALQVVDDLLWTLDPASRSADRREFAARIPPLIRLLTEGVREVGMASEELKPFLDELFLVHLRRMQGDGRERPRQASTSAPAPAAPGSSAPPTAPASPAPPVSAPPVSDPPTPPPPTLTDRRAPDDRLPPIRPARRREDRQRPVAAGDADRTAQARLQQVLSSLDLADLPTQPAVVPDAGADPVSRLRRGDWLRLIEPDRSDAYAKVAWINESRTVLLLVRHPDRRAQSMRSAELAGRFARGEACFIQPATDRPPEN
jgi:hypothetical protein